MKRLCLKKKIIVFLIFLTITAEISCFPSTENAPTLSDEKTLIMFCHPKKQYSPLFKQPFFAKNIARHLGAPEKSQIKIEYVDKDPHPSLFNKADYIYMVKCPIAIKEMRVKVLSHLTKYTKKETMGFSTDVKPRSWIDTGFMAGWTFAETSLNYPSTNQKTESIFLWKQE